MIAVARRVWANLRDFARGFVGLAVAPPRDADGVRRHFADRARNPRCC